MQEQFEEEVLRVNLLQHQLRQAQEERDAAIERAEAAEALAEETERTLTRAQRIIGSLHIERAGLIQQLAALTPAEDQARR